MVKVKGFTLIELIVVMGILAILATIVVMAVNPGRQFAASRNAKRANDTRAIAQALDQYAAASNGNAYAGITTTPQNIGTSGLDLSSILVPNYLSAIPKDPTLGSDADTKYVVFKDTTERISVVAAATEQGKTIGYGATPNLAAQFVAANSEYLSINDNAALSAGDVDFWIAGWVYLDSGSDYGLANKTDTSYGGEWELLYDNANNRFQFYTVRMPNIATSLLSTNAAALGTWHFVMAYHDAANDQLAISVNGGAFATTTFAGGVNDSATPFKLGWRGMGANYLNGRLDAFAFGKSPVGGIGATSTAIRDALYNSGKARTYADVTSSQKTTWGLVGWWNLDEDSGTRRDSHGANHLTDINTVTDAPGANL